MKIKIPFITASLLFLLSCYEQHEQTRLNSFAPKVVEAKGYMVPKDSTATPKSVLAGKPKVVLAGKPTVVPANTNIHLAGIPKIVMAGRPNSCTPGKDPFSLPKVVQAIDRPFVAGIPEVAIVKDAISKDQNSQNFSSFTKQHGLKGEAVTCLLQDKNGNIWIGTWHGGVSRYDGKNFTHFTQKEGLIHYGVLCILEDRSENIWVGTFGGLSKYDGKNFTNFTQNEGLSNNIVRSIFEDKSGNLWFGTIGGGVSKYDGKNFTHYTEKEGLSNNRVLSILEDKAGNLWFGTEGGVSKYDGKTFTNYTEKEGLSNDAVLSILQDKAGNLWFGTEGGVSKYDGRNFAHYTKKEGLSNNSVKSILEDKAGNFWFGTDGGVSKYDGKYFIHFTEEEGLANDIVITILEGRSGDLWFGTENGLLKYNGKTFSHFSRKEGLGNNDVSGIFEDKSGNLWFGTIGGGVSKYDGKNFTHYTEKEGLSNNYVSTILEDRSGNLWFGTGGGGANRFDGKSFTHYTTAQGLSNDRVESMLEDSNGNLWFGTRGGGVNKFDGKSITHYSFVRGLRNQYYTAEGLSNDFVLSMLEDSNGNFWFGTFGSGVNKFDGKSITQFTVKEGLSGNTVTGLVEDKSGYLWIGTVGGISKYDGRTFTHYTEIVGLSNNDVQSIFEDRSGNFWVGTAFGLNKLSPESLLNVSAHAIPKAIGTADKDGFADLTSNDRGGESLFKSYTYEDGFLGIGCNQHAIFEDKNGAIWIGTNDRLTTYHPEGDKKDTIAPNMQLTGVTLFNENIPWASLEQKKDTIIVLGNGVRVRNFEFDGISKWYYIPEHLSLPYNNNYLTFDFVGITTYSPKKVKYRYKLEGLDKNWSALTTRTEAPYGNLPPGNYNFIVKAMNNGGFWSKEINYGFTIRPPWWQTWWAYGIYGLLFIAAMYAVHRIQKQRVIRRERERTREHELKQSKEIEKAYTELKSTQAQLIQSEKMASLGELTAGIAHEIQNPLNFVNNFSEVNIELTDDLKSGLNKSTLPPDEKNNLVTIVDDIVQNQEKINHHGKRADAIVKGMLQHSRISNGVKEPTNINALVGEYLRLAYHGLRAKDKSFNATMKTDFDETIGNINIIPQDIGRVILNLINNAFYAVTEKKKQLTDGLPRQVNYEPTVSVSTKKVNNKVEIKVWDNGNGIPQKVLDKIFQPFFTTKPTGQGTGLGLSLSYDIVKAHGGEIKLETTEGEGTEFIIYLPVK